jgi:hypothetical protein
MADAKVDNGNTADTKNLQSFIPMDRTQLTTFEIRYTPTAGATAGRLQLTVTHPGALPSDPDVSETVTSTSMALTKEPKVLGIVYNGANDFLSTNTNSNGAKTTITSLFVNNIAYMGTLPPAKTDGTGAGSVFKVFFDCTDGAEVIITGTAEFQWRNGATGGNNARPFVYFALGEPEVRPTLACPPRRCLESCLQPQKSPRPQ